MSDLEVGILELFAEAQIWASVEARLDGLPFRAPETAEARRVRQNEARRGGRRLRDRVARAKREAT